MYSNFRSSPRSNLMREGTRLNAYDGMLSMGLFLSHSSRNLDRYSKAPLGMTVSLLSNSSKVLRLVSPLKAPTSICRMEFLPSCNTSRCLNVSAWMVSMLFSMRFRYRVLAGMLGGTLNRPRRVHTTFLSWLVQEQTPGQFCGLAEPSVGPEAWHTLRAGNMRESTASRAAFQPPATPPPPPPRWRRKQDEQEEQEEEEEEGAAAAMKKRLHCSAPPASRREGEEKEKG
ncbi:LOW QUALITY PROTEIN: hypothetical protein CRUP_009157, partial [Coryphaenoides rupestris]